MTGDDIDPGPPPSASWRIRRRHAHRPHGRRTTLLIALAVLCGAEGLLRLVPVGRVDQLDWPTAEYQRKADDMQALAGSETGGIVFVGSSVIDAGIDPVQLDRILDPPVPSYNAALLGASPKVVEAWVREVVVPELHPQVVVFGASSRDLNASAPELASIEMQFDRAAAVGRLRGTESWVQLVERRFSDWSYLVRYRAALRRPVRAVRNQPPQEGVEQLDPSAGGLEGYYLDRQYEVSPGRLEQLRTTILGDFQPNGRELDSVRSLARWLVAQDIRVVIVDVPVTRDYVASHPNGMADYARYQELIAAVALEVGAEHMAAGLWATEFFAEPVHLNGSGVVRLTADVADRLDHSAATG